MADFFHLAPRTLRAWRRHFTLTGLRMAPLGRPIQVVARHERNDVIHFLDEWGPGVGLPTLQTMFPMLARAELADILSRYRRVWRRLHEQTIHVLHWSEVGRVWALDFHGPRPCHCPSALLLLLKETPRGGDQSPLDPCPGLYDKSDPNKRERRLAEACCPFSSGA